MLYFGGTLNKRVLDFLPVLPVTFTYSSLCLSVLHFLSPLLFLSFEFVFIDLSRYKRIFVSYEEPWCKEYLCSHYQVLEKENYHYLESLVYSPFHSPFSPLMGSSSCGLCIYGFLCVSHTIATCVCILRKYFF